jgi:hypothetical protein
MSKKLVGSERELKLGGRSNCLGKPLADEAAAASTGFASLGSFFTPLPQRRSLIAEKFAAAAAAAMALTPLSALAAAAEAAAAGVPLDPASVAAVLTAAKAEALPKGKEIAKRANWGEGLALERLTQALGY